MKEHCYNRVAYIAIIFIMVFSGFTIKNISYDCSNDLICNRSELERSKEWLIETIEDSVDCGEESSIVMDSNDIPHIIYYENHNSNLEYARWTGSEWRKTNVIFGVDSHHSLDIDSDDILHLSYKEEHYPQGLAYAKRSEYSWIDEIVDYGPEVGTSSSIAVDSNNHPHICYRDNENDLFKYARWNGSEWKIDVIDGSADVGYFNSIAIDSNDHAHISYSYNDWVNCDLKYTRWNGTEWINETVDSKGDVGYSSSMEIDSKDRPHISYLDRSDYKTKYAFHNGNEWVIEELINDGISGWYNPIELDSNDNPHIAYYQYFRNESGRYNWSVLYAKRTDGLWDVQVVDDPDPDERIGGVSLALDSKDVPHISYYYEYPTFELKYARIVKSPTPPMDMRCRGGDDFVNLFWNHSSDNGGIEITNYNLFRGENTENMILIGSLDYPISSFNDTSVENGKRYFYYITAENPVGESDPSDTISVTPMDIPSAPSNIAIDYGDEFILLNWDPPPDNGGSRILNYSIFRGDNPDKLSLLDRVPPQIEYYNDTGVTNGRTYYYQLAASNMLGYGRKSEVVFTTPFGLPSPPRDIEAISGNEYVLISWDHPEDDGGSMITGYRLHRIDENHITTEHEFTPSSTYFNDTSVVNGISYTYYLTSINIIGEGGRSEEIMATPMSIPSSPLNLELIPGDGFINIMWNSPSNDGGGELLEYRIYKGETPNEMELYKKVDDLIEFYNDTDVINSNKYYYYVTAVNNIGEGPKGQTKWTVPFGLPSAPIGLRMEIGDGFIKLSWREPTENRGSNIIQYNIYRITSSVSDELLASVKSNETYYNDTSLINGRTYHYFITALTYFGEGERSITISGSPSKDISIPSEPMDLEINYINREVKIEWDPPLKDGDSEITGYKVYRGIDPDRLEFLDMVENEFYYDSDLEEGKKYFYAVSAVNSAGEGERSPSANITIENDPADKDSSKITPLLLSIIVVLIVILISLIVIFIYMKKRRSTDVDWSYRSKNGNDPP